MDETQRDPLTYAIIGAAMEVHNCLGRGFLEKVYHEALKIEFNRRNIPFSSEARLPIRYKDVALDCHYQVDFICFNEVIVEIKALNTVGPNEYAQVINYLRASNITRGLLINFGATLLDYERFANDYKGKAK